MGGLPLRPAFPALESGQRPDGLPYPLLGHSELIETLEVEPEFGAGPEEVAEAQRGVASNGPLAIPIYPRSPYWSRPYSPSLATAEGSLCIRNRDHQCHGIDRRLDKAVPLVEPLRLRGDRVHENGTDSTELGGLQGPENCFAQQSLAGIRRKPSPTLRRKARRQARH